MSVNICCSINLLSPTHELTKSAAQINFSYLEFLWGRLCLFQLHVYCLKAKISITILINILNIYFDFITFLDHFLDYTLKKIPSFSSNSPT